MSWQVLILFSVFTYSVSILLQRVLVKEDKSDPIAFSITFQFITGILIGLYGYATQDMRLPNLTPIVGNIVLMITMYTLGNYFLFNALKHIEASKFTVIFSSRAFFTVVASTIFLQESLDLRQWAGAVLIFLAIILVTGKIRNRTFQKAEWFALLAAMCFGFEITNDRILLRTLSVYPFSFWGFLLPGVVLSLVYRKSVPNISRFLRPQTLATMVLLCTIYAASALAFFVGLQIAPNSSQVTTVNLTSVIVIVLLSIVFLKEHTEWVKKVIGAVISFAGLLLLR